MKLIDKLPYFYEECPKTNSIQDGLGSETENLYSKVRSTTDQLYVSSATWGLDLWEKLLDIKEVSNDTEERRSIIYTKLRGTSTTTVEVVKQIAQSFFNVDNVEVYEDYPNYSFYVDLENAQFDTIKFKDMERMLDIYKPAHLGLGFVLSSKTNVEINSTKKVGYSVLPICNVTHVGTWWKSFALGSQNKGKVIKANTIKGYSRLVICGIYKSKYCNHKHENLENKNSIAGSAIVGIAMAGGVK